MHLFRVCAGSRDNSPNDWRSCLVHDFPLSRVSVHGVMRRNTASCRSGLHVCHGIMHRNVGRHARAWFIVGGIFVASVGFYVTTNHRPSHAKTSTASRLNIDLPMKEMLGNTDTEPARAWGVVWHQTHRAIPDRLTDSRPTESF
jgi:hypothetical protein